MFLRALRAYSSQLCLNYRIVTYWTPDLSRSILFFLNILHLMCLDYIFFVISLKDLLPLSVSRPLTLLPIQKYQDTVVALKDQLTSYCVQVCSTCILQDAESHHWADPKPFYEVKKNAFTIET